MPSNPESLPVEAEALLQECSVLLSSFRNKLSTAGYPFREPPGAGSIISRIDNYLSSVSVSTNGTVIDGYAIPRIGGLR